ncbi:DUF1572 domain-containing protein [bacterium]|nr:DUF1572 domain-containing protein [bacterium]
MPEASSPSKIASDSVAVALIAGCGRRLFDDSLPRLKKCLSLLSEEEIWFRPNAQTVSVGNLVLHLCGNVRQWIISGLSGAQDVREREKEFSEPGPIPPQELVKRLESTMNEVRIILADLEPASLLEERSVQGRRESGVSILVHVVEHFSYHVGQVSYSIKSHKDLDLGYFEGVDLNKLNPD